MSRDKGNSPFKAEQEKNDKMRGLDRAMKIVEKMQHPTKDRPFVHKERVQTGPVKVVDEETTYEEIDEIFGTEGKNLVSSMMQRIRDYEDVINELTDENKRLRESNGLSGITSDISDIRNWILMCTIYLLNNPIRLQLEHFGI